MFSTTLEKLGGQKFWNESCLRRNNSRSQKIIRREYGCVFRNNRIQSRFFRTFQNSHVSFWRFWKNDRNFRRSEPGSTKKGFLVIYTVVPGMAKTSYYRYLKIWALDEVIQKCTKNWSDRLRHPVSKSMMHWLCWVKYNETQKTRSNRSIF